jgi:hypothetical protein
LSSALRAVIAQNCPKLAADLERPLLDLLRIARDLCGDAEMCLVLLSIAIRTLQHREFRGISTAELAAGLTREPPSLGTNVRSISESLGAPRESTRRRVRELIDRGLVVRSRRSLMLSAHGANRLAPFRQAVIALAACYVQIVMPLSERAPDRGWTRG